MEIETRRTPNFEAGRSGERPRGIVVHTNAGSFSSTCWWFEDEESGVSAHYLVALDGRVARFVDEADTARHSGRVVNPTTPLYEGGDPNRYTVGIEFEDDGDPAQVHRTDAQYRAGAELIRGICRRWGIPLDRDHVVGHSEINGAKTCPGNLDIERLLEEAAGTR
jgi:N-acetylmuramoyl-L-alanine amidase